MTYSIVARDPGSGALGVAVQSHWFSVGALVPWARPGVGAVATQANVDVAYGPRALELLGRGRAAPDALAELVAADASAATRQVAVIDAAGRVAVHTGAACFAHAGHEMGEEFACQANMMAGPGVWPAMAAAFRAAAGPLEERLMTALEAAEAAGGDVRGRQSAAIVVVGPGGAEWERRVDLRVEDDAEPLLELRRLLLLHRAYALAGEGDELTGGGRLAEAADRYLAAHELAPDNAELSFWAGLSLVAMGDHARGLDRVRHAIAERPAWREFLERMPAGSAPGVEETRRLLLG